MAEPVDWKKLRTPFGPATRIPKLVKSMLTSRNTREEVRWDSFLELRDSLIDGETCTTASSKTIELMIESQPVAIDFEYSLWLIADLVALDVFEAWLNRGARPATSVPEHAACLQALESHRELVCNYLQSEKPGERTAAAALLGVVPSWRDMSIPLLEQRFAIEPEELTRASVLLALEMLDPGDRWKQEIEHLAKSDHGFLPGVATLCWLRQDPKHRAREVVEGLRAWLDVELEEYFGWFHVSHLGEHDLVLARVLQAREPKLSEDLIDTFGALAKTAESSLLVDNITRTLNRILNRPGWKETDAVIPASQLSPEMRRLAEGLSGTVIYPKPRWMPAPGQCRRRWLGLEPPSALERTVSVESSTTGNAKQVWQILVEHSADSSSSELLPSALRAQLSFEEQWRALAELPLYGAFYKDWSQVSEYGRTLTVTDELEAQIHRLCREALHRGRALGNEADLASVAVTRLLLLPLVRSHRPIPQEFYPLVSLSEHPDDREVLAALPGADAGKAIAAKLAGAEPMTALSIATNVLKYLEAAPTPAACDALVKVVQQWLPESKDPRFHVLFRAALENIPELKAAQERAEAAPSRPERGTGTGARKSRK